MEFSFLYTLTELNITVSTIRNPKAQEQYEHLKQGNRVLSLNSPSRWSRLLEEETTREKEKCSIPTLDSTSLKENTIIQILKILFYSYQCGQHFILTLIHKGF